jgi:Acetyl-CoA acetyltransferase
MQKVVICEPLRTAIGAFGGSLKDFPAATLGSTVVKEILSHTDIDPKVVDDVIMGNCLPAGQGMNPSRQVALNAGLKSRNSCPSPK